MNTVTEAAMYDELEKIAAATSLAKEKGIKRIGELLTGSRVKKLEDRAANVAGRAGKVEDATAKARAAVAPQKPGEPAIVHRMRELTPMHRGAAAKNSVADARHTALRKADAEKEDVLTARISAVALPAGAAIGAHYGKKHREEREAKANGAA